MSTCSKVSGAFRGLRPNPTGSALPFSCFRRPHDDTASFTSCCGPPNCSTPLRTRHLSRPRGHHYRGPWRLPGPDLHRLVVVSFSLGLCHGCSFAGTAPRAAGRTGLWWDPRALRVIFSRDSSASFMSRGEPASLLQKGGFVDAPSTLGAIECESTVSWPVPYVNSVVEPPTRVRPEGSNLQGHVRSSEIGRSLQAHLPSCARPGDTLLPAPLVPR